MAFTSEFWKDAQKQTQWQAFVRKSKPEDVSEDFGSVIRDVAAFPNLLSPGFYFLSN